MVNFCDNGGRDVKFDGNLERLVGEALIYLVDDEEQNVRLLERLLNKHGFRRVVGTTSPQALQTLVAKETPDLLLTDFKMPGLDGLELLKTLPPLNPAMSSVPVLMLTGDLRIDTKRLALQEGVRDFINKPFDPVEVVCRIRNLLESRVVHSELARQNLSLQQQKETGPSDREAALVRCIAVTAEYRDDPTGLHSRRVGRYAALLAQQGGMEAELCRRLSLAAQLHDIGMTAVPDHILLKNSPLDASEWEVIKNHPLSGSQMLRTVEWDFLSLAEVVARTHHERWDGTGYPYGLEGADIPLEGRIVGLCDAFEALTSDRPYRGALSVTNAVTEIQSGAGTHFDPDLVGLFVKILPALLMVRSTQS